MIDKLIENKMIDISLIDTEKYENLRKENEKKIEDILSRNSEKQTRNHKRGKGYYYKDDIAEHLGISESKAYKVIRKLNMELEEKGFFVLAGRVPKKYFAEKYYGFSADEEEYE